MSLDAQRIAPDFRMDTRFRVNFRVTGQHRHLDTIFMHVVDISSTGLMVDERAGVERGDSITIRLPNVKVVEALCIWTWHQIAGLQFDEPLNSCELAVAFNGKKAQ